MAGGKVGAAAQELRSVWQRLRQSLSLPGVEAWSTSLRSLFLNLIFLGLLIILIPLLAAQFRRDQVIIEPIAVPEALALQGLTSEVAASRVWDGLQDVIAAADTSKQSITALPDSRRVEFSFPDSGLSIESLVFHVRRMFNAYETRIAGEFVCSDAACERSGLKLRLRLVRDRVDLIDLGPLGARDERAYFAEAASGVLSILDPFVALSAASKTQPVKATTLARRLIRAHHPDAKWAHNLAGLIRFNDGDLGGSIEDFRGALALDQGFLPARANLANVMLKSGDLEGARAELEEITRRDPANLHGKEGLADLALAHGDSTTAVRRLLEAAELDPLDPRYLARAGKIELDLGRKAEGEKLLRRSLELDPGYLPAFAYLGSMYLVAEDYAAAERIYRDAADYSPDNAAAQASHARLLMILKQWDSALQRLGRAIALLPDNDDYLLNYARCLQKLGRHDEALTTLEAALKIAPQNADIQMSMADSYRDLGRNREAVEAYRKFLEIDKTESPMRLIAQRFIETLSG